MNDFRGCRTLLLLICMSALFMFSFFYWYVASAYTVGLKREQHLGDGYKLCIYDDDITLRIRTSEFCPLRMEI